VSRSRPGALLVGGGLLLAVASGAAAVAEPEGRLVNGLTAQAASDGVGMTFGDPSTPPYPVGAGQLAHTEASLTTGPTGYALASTAWPGPVVANAGSLVVLLGGPAEAGQANYGGRAEAYSSGPTDAELPGMRAHAADGVAEATAGAQDVETAPGALTGDVVTVSRTGFEAGALGVSSTCTASDLAFGEAVRIGSVRTEATATSDGDTATSAGRTVVSGLTIGGQAAEVDEEGVRFVDPLTAAVGEQVLAQAGMELYVSAPRAEVDGARGSYRSGALVVVWEPPQSGQLFVYTICGSDAVAAVRLGAPAATPAPAGKPEPLLPVETLRTLNIDGKFTAGKIIVTELPMTNLVATVKAKDGDIHLDPFSAGVLEGTVRGSVRVDARGAEPRIVTRLVLDRIEVGGLVKRFAGKDLFLGKTSLNLDVDATGNDVDTLMKKAVGALDLSFADATLKGMNLTNELNTALTAQLGAFSMLIPDYQEKLPKEMSQDTVFSALAAKAKIKDGVAEVPSFNAGVKDGAIKGGGKFNLVSMDFDYTLAMTTTKLADNKYFAKSEFPVRCKGNIAGAPASWCRPDSAAIGDMLKKAAGNAAKDRLKGELAEKLGIKGGTTEEVKQQVKEEVKKEAETKAKEEVKKELNKALQKFF